MSIDTALRTLTRLVPTRRERTSEAEHVHFHRGPQGRPAPCHDRHCASPQLDV